MSEKLTLLQINDTHAYLESHHELFWNGKEALYKEVGVYRICRQKTPAIYLNMKID